MATPVAAYGARDMNDECRAPRGTVEDDLNAEGDMSPTPTTTRSAFLALGRFEYRGKGIDLVEDHSRDASAELGCNRAHTHLALPMQTMPTGRRDRRVGETHRHHLQRRDIRASRDGASKSPPRLCARRAHALAGESLPPGPLWETAAITRLGLLWSAVTARPLSWTEATSRPHRVPRRVGLVDTTARPRRWSASNAAGNLPGQATPRGVP